MPNASVKYQKQTTATDVNIVYTIDTLVVSGNSASTGIFINANPPDITVANVTVTKGSTGSGISTLTTSTTNGFQYIPVGATITLSVAGGAAIPTSAVVTSKPNNVTLVIDKEATANSTSAGSSTILAAISSANFALCKLTLTLDGIGTSNFMPKCAVSFYDGKVKYSEATANNATETQTVSKTINMQTYLGNVGVAPVDTNTLDVSV